MIFLEGEPPALGKERIVLAVVSASGKCNSVSFDVLSQEIARIHDAGLIEKFIRPGLQQLVTKGGM